MELTPPVAYRMSMTAAEVEALLLSVYTKVPKDAIRTSLENPSDDTIPTTKAVADAIAVITTDLEQLGALALLDTIDLGGSYVVGVLPIGKGGTGGNTVEQAQQNLGIVVESEIQEMIDNAIPEIQSIDLGSDQATGVLPLSKGGTGATGASQARTNLGVWSSEESSVSKIAAVESLRRTYAEVGFNLVSGSFELGGVLSSTTDVLRRESTGKAYSSSGPFPKNVAVGTDPTSDANYTDQSGKLLVAQLATSAGATMVSTSDGRSVQQVLDDTQNAGPFKVTNVNPNLSPMLTSDRVNFSIIGILQTGQSLAEGGVGYDATPAMQPLNRACRQLVGGPIGIDTEVLETRSKVIHERGVRGTVGTTLSDAVVSAGPASRSYFHGQAKGGEPYSTLKKGGSTGVYEKCITQVGSVFAEESSIVYAAVNCIHGEQDGLNNNPSYEANLGEWISNFNTDIKAITGQAADIKMFISQTNSACGYGQVGGITNTNFQTPLQQLAAHKNNPLITLTGPKYHMKYVDQSHISNLSQSFLGEKDGQAMAWQIKHNTKWQPLRPLSFSLNGNELLITFTGSMLDAPDGAIAFETSAIQAVSNFGFEYKDASGVLISSVTILNKNTVRILLNAPHGTGSIIAYAYKNGSSGSVQQANGFGERGQLRDNDPTLSKIDGRHLYNYCVTFREVL